MCQIKMENNVPPSNNYAISTNAASTTANFWGNNAPVLTWQNSAIIILAILLVFSFMGINLLSILGNALQGIGNAIIPIIERILNVLGFSLGSLLNFTGDFVEDVGTKTLDLANDGIHGVTGIFMNDPNYKRNVSSVGTNNLLQGAQLAPITNPVLDQTIQQGPSNGGGATVAPSTAASPVQTSIPAANKAQWCLVGEYNERRGCVAIGQNTQCMSGQVFPTQNACLNPNLGPSA